MRNALSSSSKQHRHNCDEHQAHQLSSMGDAPGLLWRPFTAPGPGAGCWGGAGGGSRAGGGKSGAKSSRRLKWPCSAGCRGHRSPSWCFSRRECSWSKGDVGATASRRRCSTLATASGDPCCRAPGALTDHMLVREGRWGRVGWGGGTGAYGMQCGTKRSVMKFVLMVLTALSALSALGVTPYHTSCDTC